MKPAGTPKVLLYLSPFFFSSVRASFLRPGAENWQDHWCPSYFPLVGNVEVCAGDTVRLKVTHSELNIMFEVLGVDAESDQELEEGKPAGTPDSKGAFSFSRGGQISPALRQTSLILTTVCQRSME